MARLARKTFIKMYQKKFPYLLNLRIKVKTHNHKCIFVKTNLHICSSFSINHSLIVCLYTSEAHPSTDKRNQQSTNNVKQNLTYFIFISQIFSRFVNTIGKYNKFWPSECFASFISFVPVVLWDSHVKENPHSTTSMRYTKGLGWRGCLAYIYRQTL